MWADMQGTEMLLPLQAIFEDPPSKPRSVFVLTDGRVRLCVSRLGFSFRWIEERERARERAGR
jgi:hypothetical protein